MPRFFTLAILVLFIIIITMATQAFQLPPDDRALNYNLPVPEQTDIIEKTKPKQALPPYESDCLAQPAAPTENLEPDLSSNPEIVPRQPLIQYNPDPMPEVFCRDSIYFLLIGRPWEKKKIDFLMIVTLSPESHSNLTVIDPYYYVEHGGQVIPVSYLLAEGGNYADLCKVVANITGLTPSFYLDLNSHGFKEMLNILGGIDHDIFLSLAEKPSNVVANTEELDGAELIAILNDSDVSTAIKEKLIISLLLSTRKAHNTARGLRILWTGYRNLKSDLGLSDLLAIRAVAVEICPTQVRFREVPYRRVSVAE